MSRPNSASNGSRNRLLVLIRMGHLSSPCSGEAAWDLLVLTENPNKVVDCVQCFSCICGDKDTVAQMSFAVQIRQI
jgi:hypothetical protein